MSAMKDARRRNQTVQLYLYPAKVQGEGASAEIARGIRYFDKAGVDIIIIGRGGGSIEDLWAFNEMPVADAIYEADTPIISGTGHEVDMTIADYCADVRAATPSAACELAIPDMQSIFTKLSNYREALDMQAEQRCAQLRQQMILLQRQLEAGRPDRKLLKHKLLYERLENRLSQAIKEKYRSRQQMFSRYVDQLSGLAPTNRLKGGYAFAQTKDGRPVASIEQLEKEVPFFLTFSDGEAEVIPVHLKKNKKIKRFVMAKTKFSIEGAFEQLEDIIEQLSSEEISLSDSMDLYKKGVKILDKCSQTLDKTQKEIIILQEGQNEAIHKGTASEED